METWKTNLDETKKRYIDWWNAHTMILLLSISANTTNQSCLLYGKHWRLSQWEHSLSSIPIFQMPRQNMLSQESSV